MLWPRAASLVAGRTWPIGRWLLIGAVLSWFSLLILVPSLALVRQVFLGGLVAEVPDKDIGHQKSSLWIWKQVGSEQVGSDNAGGQRHGRDTVLRAQCISAGTDGNRSYPWIGRSISVKNNTADPKIFFLHPVKRVHYLGKSS